MGVVAVAAAVPLHAQDAEPASSASPSIDPAAAKLIEQIKKAYRDTDQYQVRIRFEAGETEGRWLNIKRSTFDVALDRKNRKLKIDGPGGILAINGKTLRFKLHGTQSIHLKQPTPPKLTYKRLDKLIQFVGLPATPVLPDVAFCIADDPISLFIHGNAPDRVTLKNDDYDSANTLIIAAPGHHATLHIDLATHMITEATIEHSHVEPATAQATPHTWRYTFETGSREKLVKPAIFEIDTNKSVAYGSFKEYVNAASSMIKGMPPPPPLIGINAPPIRLKTLGGESFDMAEVDADVIVLDFWATWCGPCRISLATLEKVHQWAIAKKKSVAIFTVNQGETEDQVTAYWRNNHLSLPVLMDRHQSVGWKYGTRRGIPVTAFISGGKIVEVFHGVSTRGDPVQILQAQIERMLEGAARADKNKSPIAGNKSG